MTHGRGVRYLGDSGSVRSCPANRVSRPAQLHFAISGFCLLTTLPSSCSTQQVLCVLPWQLTNRLQSSQDVSFWFLLFLLFLFPVLDIAMNHIEPPERLALRTALAKMRKDIEGLAEVGILDQATLQRHSIRVLPLCLDGVQSSGLMFFTPSPAQQIPDAVESYVGREYDVSDEERHSRRADAIYTYLEEYLQRLSLEPPFKKTAWSSLQ